MVFDNGSKGIVLDGMTPKVVEISDNQVDHLWHHDEQDPIKAYILSRFFDNDELPRPFGVLYCNNNRDTFDDAINAQINAKQIADKKAAFNQLLRSNSSWVVG